MPPSTPPSTPPQPAPAAPPPQPEAQKLIIAIVAPHKQEGSLTLAVSLMNLQMQLAKTVVQPSLVIVDSFDAAVNAAVDADAHLLALDTMVGFDPAFVLKGLESPHDVVTAVFPSGPFKWERVQAADKREPAQHRGNTYNAKPAPLGTGPVDGYVRAAVAKLGCLLVKKHVPADILARHPECRVTLADGKSGGRFAYESVVDGKVSPPHDTFAALWGGPIHMDVGRPGSYTGTMAYAGCVGQREVLR